MTENAIKSGGCLCRDVRYQVNGPLRDVHACHCGQCQKTSGHYFAATAAATKDFTITKDDGLKWYKSSEQAERGFCAHCGSSLFWRMKGLDYISILAGSLDDKNTGLKTDIHIFVADKKDYYDLTDGLPQYDLYPEAEK